jgi:hypothetical protein
MLVKFNSQLTKLVEDQLRFSYKLSTQISWSGFHKAIYTLRLKIALCAHPFSTNLLSSDIMHLHLVLNLLHFLTDLGVLYALRHVPNFYEIHPGSQFKLKCANNNCKT